MAGWGWFFALTATGATATGATIIPLAVDGELSSAQKATAVSLTLGGGLLALAARAMFHRSDAASTLASSSASILAEREDGMSLTSSQLSSKCNRALAAWEKSRTDATAVASSLLEKEKAEKAEEDSAAGKSDAADKGKLELLGNLLAKLCPAGKCSEDVIKSITDSIKK